jgi:hypothetical protein
LNPVTEQQQQQLIIDEFGELNRQVTAFKPVAKRHRQLQETIVSWFDDNPAEGHRAEGGLYRVILGPRLIKRRVTKMRALARALGARFWELCSFGVEACEDNVLDPSKFISSTQSGPRSIDVILLEPAAKKAA